MSFESFGTPDEDQPYIQPEEHNVSDGVPFVDYGHHSGEADLPPLCDDPGIFPEHVSEQAPEQVEIWSTDQTDDTTYIQGVYEALNMTFKPGELPSTRQLRKAWRAANPDDMTQRLRVAEALWGRRIDLMDRRRLLANTYEIIINGGNFKDLVQEYQGDRPDQQEFPMSGPSEPRPRKSR